MQICISNSAGYLGGAINVERNQALEYIDSLVDDKRKNAIYFQRVENSNPPRSLIDPTQLVFPGCYIVAIARGKSEHTKNRLFLILESVEQQHFTFRRIDLVNAVPMEMLSGLSVWGGVLKSGIALEVDKIFVEMQTMQDEYTIDCEAISAADGAVLRSKVEQENLCRLSKSPTSTRAGLRMFSDRPATQAFFASLTQYLKSIDVNILANNSKRREF